MNLKITSIADRGIAGKERLVLKASSSVQLGSFMLVRSYVNANKQITTYLTDFLWFADKTISAGDQVIVYTKEGVGSERVLESGSKAHFVYWGKTESLWEDKEFAPVLVLVQDWQPFISP